MSNLGNQIRRYIVQVATGRFLTETGEWTEAIESAMTFTSFTALLRACRERHLKNVDILMQPVGSARGVRIPLHC